MSVSSTSPVEGLYQAMVMPTTSSPYFQPLFTQERVLWPSWLAESVSALWVRSTASGAPLAVQFRNAVWTAA